MIRQVGETVGDAVFDTLGRVMSRAQEQRSLPVDLLESDEAYLAIFDAPGALSSDVQVRYEDGSILVRVDRFREFFEGFEMRFPGRGQALDGQVELPQNATVDPSGASAILKNNGTLHVRLPKTNEDQTDETTRKRAITKRNGESTDR